VKFKRLGGESRGVFGSVQLTRESEEPEGDVEVVRVELKCGLEISDRLA
jgi:hypothetical protein